MESSEKFTSFLQKIDATWLASVDLSPKFGELAKKTAQVGRTQESQCKSWPAWFLLLSTRKKEGKQATAGIIDTLHNCIHPHLSRSRRISAKYKIEAFRPNSRLLSEQTNSIKNEKNTWTRRFSCVTSGVTLRNTVTVCALQMEKMVEKCKEEPEIQAAGTL